MAGTAVRRRLNWRVATVVAKASVSDTAARLSLDVPEWPGHLPGQHVDVRLTAPDGYQAQRSYSIASAPEHPGVDLVVQRVVDGEVSPHLTEGVREGDRFELRGPIGGYFVWHTGLGGPVQLIAGGSGVVPFLAMLDHHAEANSTVAVRLLYSVRTTAAVIAHDQLDAHATRGVGVTITLTRADGAAGSSRHGRIDAHALSDLAWSAHERPQVFICGPTSFVESVAKDLVGLGHAPSSIKTERFG